jgi:hypothetical protein
MRVLAMAVLTVGLTAPSAFAAVPDAFAKSLDRPVATKIIRAKGDAGEVTCTYYADLMVRESGTETPDPDNATLTPIAKGAPRPACLANAPAGAISVKTEGYALEGRRGGFLIWDASDPNGAIPFMVMNPAGKVLFEDGLSPSLGLKRSGTLAGGVLRLQYTRGYNADCSLVKDAKGCWARLAAAGHVATSIRPLTAPPAACVRAYGKTPHDDPSVVTYTIDMTLDAAGKAAVTSLGPVSCQPTP